MSQLEPLIADLALILICAGAMTLLFKSLKQPIVLGYIVAGFLASPNMPYMPSVTDMHGIHVWSEIGVIFLLFALGLEFSFKKILKMGAAPIIAAVCIILSMMYVGACTGELFGWSQMDCIYLGGMLAMSSTTIIFKAFDDMASMPPKKMQSIWLQPKSSPVQAPTYIMHRMIASAAIIGAAPIFRIFLNENSRPRAKSRKMTPISLHTWMPCISVTLGM